MGTEREGRAACSKPRPRTPHWRTGDVRDVQLRVYGTESLTRLHRVCLYLRMLRLLTTITYESTVGGYPGGKRRSLAMSGCDQSKAKLT